MAGTGPEKGPAPATKTFETRAQAEQWARAIEVEMDKGVFVSRAEAESTTLEELPLLAAGSPRRVGFLSSLATFDDRTGGLPWVRRTTSPYPVRLHVSWFSGYQVSLYLACSTSSPTPYSRFAVRYVHRFCLMLPSDTPLSGNALALLASSFRPVTADHHVPDSRRERRPVRHARHTRKPRCGGAPDRQLSAKTSHSPSRGASSEADICRRPGSLYNGFISR